MIWFRGEDLLFASSSVSCYCRDGAECEPFIPAMLDCSLSDYSCSGRPMCFGLSQLSVWVYLARGIRFLIEGRMLWFWKMFSDGYFLGNFWARGIHLTMRGEEMHNLWERVRFWASLWASISSWFKDISFSTIFANWNAAVYYCFLFLFWFSVVF